MNRKFSYITVGKIIDALKADGISISRRTLIKLETENLFLSNRSVGKWRVYSPEEARIIIKLVKENYRFVPTAELNN